MVTTMLWRDGWMQGFGAMALLNKVFEALV
jgi:hypothetical protein